MNFRGATVLQEMTFKIGLIHGSRYKLLITWFLRRNVFKSIDLQQIIKSIDLQQNFFHIHC